jgi:hypothetical protein
LCSGMAAAFRSQVGAGAAAILIFLRSQ